MTFIAFLDENGDIASVSKGAKVNRVIMIYRIDFPEPYLFTRVKTERIIFD